MAKNWWVIQMNGEYDGTTNTRPERRSELVPADQVENVRQQMRQEMRAVPAYSSDWVSVQEP